MRHHIGWAFKVQVHLARQQIHNRLAAALVGNVVHLRLRGQHEAGRRQVLRTATARRCKAQAHGLLLGQRHKRAHIGGGHARVHRQQQRGGRDADDGREILHHVVRQFGVNGRGHRIGIAVAEQQCVTVGPGLGHDVGAHGARCTRLVVHHHRLPQALLQLLANGARQHISKTTGRKAHHDADRLVRPVLGKSARA